MADRSIGENFKALFEPFELQKFIDNFKSMVTGKYFCFDGRAGFEEFWRYILVVIVFGWLPAVGQLFLLITLLPTLGITARRLHDTGQTGWLQLISLVPVLGPIVVLFLCAQPAKTENNPF